MGYQAVGEFTNHSVIDSAAFGLPLLYGKQLPDLCKSGINNDTKPQE